VPPPAARPVSARPALFPLQAAAAFALVSADLEAGLESLGPSCNAMSPGSFTTTSPCWSSNAAADAPRFAAARRWPATLGRAPAAARRQASQPRDRGTSGSGLDNLAVELGIRGRRRISSC
jgi:hypothetical protein